MRTLRLNAIAALMAATLTACGGGGGGDPIAGTPPPAPQFRDFQSASIVLGQANFESSRSGPTEQGSFLAIRGSLAVGASGKLYAPDGGNNRVLVFPSESGTGALAEFVLGQEGFENNVETVAQGFHPGAAHVAIGGDRMAVAEPAAHRVSLYASVPLSDSARPEALLGQDSFLTSSPDCLSDKLNRPEGVAITPDGNALVVADSGNHRVNIYYTFPETPPAPDLDAHLGQPTATVCLPNGIEGVPSHGTLNQPMGVWTDGKHIVVADTGNNRVLIWHSFPTQALGRIVPANQVLGQEDFSSVAANRGSTTPGKATMNGPMHVASDGTRLAVADTGNHRVLIWSTFPTGDGAPADRVLGQADFAGNLANGGLDGVSARGLFLPSGLHFSGGKLYVTDLGNNRVLIFEPQ